MASDPSFPRAPRVLSLTVSRAELAGNTLQMLVVRHLLRVMVLGTREEAASLDKDSLPPSRGCRAMVAPWVHSNGPARGRPLWLKQKETPGNSRTQQTQAQTSEALVAAKFQASFDVSDLPR